MFSLSLSDTQNITMLENSTIQKKIKSRRQDLFRRRAQIKLDVILF